MVPQVAHESTIVVELQTFVVAGVELLWSDLVDEV